MSERPYSRTVAIRYAMLSVAWCCLQTPAVSQDEFWDDRFGVPGVPYEEGVVSAMLAVGEDLYVGGTFRSIGGLVTTSIARWDGTNWHALGSGIDGGVFELVHIRGELIAAGHFVTAGGTSTRHVARWDGERWSDVAGGVNGTVFALASDGTNLYAGGHFTEAGGVAASKVAKWDGEQWSELGAGIIPVYEPNDWVGAVDSLAVSGRSLHVGGRFRNAGGIGATNIARWDGTNWHALGSGLRYFDGPGSENGAVRALTPYRGGVVASGEFRIAGEARATNIAYWSNDRWLSLGGSVGDGLSVQALATAGEDLYAGGVFLNIGGVVAKRIAKWDGLVWSPLGSGIEGGGVTRITVSGADLLIGGLFTTAGGKPSTNLALWHIPHTLKIRAETDAVRLSWPSTGTNFALETKDSVQATAWSEVGDMPAALNSEIVVTQAVSRASQVYRLRRR